MENHLPAEMRQRGGADPALHPFPDELETQVRERIEELQRANACLEQRVGEQMAQLEALNKELEAFSYSVSHDLRAPLRAIDGFGRALLDDNSHQLDPTGKEHLQRMRAASQRMGELIDDLLKLCRLARSEMHRETIDLTAIARHVAAELQRAQPAREVRFVIADGMTAYADARLLEALLVNLLGNAWKFTSQKPTATIEFGVTEKDGNKIYVVRDDGAGFDMAYADKLFGAFQRLHITGEFEGRGIGLATVQRIIHRHGGQVWAEGAIDNGASFSFTLEERKDA